MRSNFTATLGLAQKVLPQLITLHTKDGNINPSRLSMYKIYHIQRICKYMKISQATLRLALPVLSTAKGLVQDRRQQGKKASMVNIDIAFKDPFS